MHRILCVPVTPEPAHCVVSQVSESCCSCTCTCTCMHVFHLYTESGLLHQSSSSTLQAPSTITSHTNPSKPPTTSISTSLPPLTSSTITTSNTDPPPPACNTLAGNEWRERGEEKRREDGEEGGRPATDLCVRAHDQESLSSLPLSIPVSSRYTRAVTYVIKYTPVHSSFHTNNYVLIRVSNVYVHVYV